jgi:hypothetical protein
MPFFRGRQYQTFFEDLDSTEGFYAHRWGDAPIRLLGLAMYAQPEQVKLLDLPYAHKVYQQNAVTESLLLIISVGLRQCRFSDSSSKSSAMIQSITWHLSCLKSQKSMVYVAISVFSASVE